MLCSEYENKEKVRMVIFDNRHDCKKESFLEVNIFMLKIKINKKSINESNPYSTK